jgi:hypothetical protein
LLKNAMSKVMPENGSGRIRFHHHQAKIACMALLCCFLVLYRSGFPLKSLECAELLVLLQTSSVALK